MTVPITYLGYEPDIGASETVAEIPSRGPYGTPRLDWFDGYGEMAEGWEGEWVSGEPEFHITDGLATADAWASAYRTEACATASSEVWGQVGPKFNEYAWQRWFLRAGGPGTGNAYGVYLPQEGAPAEIGKYAAGVWAALKVTSQVFADYDWIALVALESLGGTLQLYRWVPGDTSWTLIDSVMDATYAAAGYIGIEGNGNATFADFGGGGLAPIAREQPVATGTVTPGATLAVTSGRWYCQTPSGYAYQWQSRRRLVGTFAPISGATASTYVISEADADDRLYRCAVTATNSYGSAASPSNYLPMTYSKPPWRPDNETLEIAFGYGPTAASPVFTDVSSRLKSCTVQRGRSNEMDRIDAGSWNGVLKNPDGYLQPGNSGAPAPYAGNIKPGTPLRYTVNGVVTFYGYTAGFPQSYPSVLGAEVRLQALDAMSLLNRRKFQGATVLPEELMGARFTRVLQTEMGYVAALCDLDTGTVTATETADLIGQSPVSHLQEMALAEGGRFFISKDGKFTFRDVDGTLLGLVTEEGVFGFTAGEIIYRLGGDEIEHDDGRIINYAAISDGDGTVETAEDATSQANYGQRDFSVSWGIAAADAQVRADHIIYEQKDPHLRIPSLEILWPRCPAVAVPVIDALEIGQRFAFRYQPLAVGSDEIAMDVIVDGIMIDSQPGEYRVFVQLTPADEKHYWLIEVDGFGELEQTTYLW